MKRFIFFTSLLLCFSALHSQPFQIGTRTVTYQDPARNNRSVETVFYYPATQAGANQPFAAGNFPVIVYGHGFSMTYTAYAVYKDSLVPRGYIVAFPRTEEGLSPSHGAFGADLNFLVDVIKSEGDNTSSFLHNRLSGTFALMGHSMGGGASFLAAAVNKNYNTLINFAAAETTPSAIAAATNVVAPTLMFLGSNDGVTPPVGHQLPMYNALGASCKTLIKINGGGHCFFGDPNTACSTGEFFTSPQPTISRVQQHNVVMSFLIPYLDFMLKHNMASKNVFQDSLSSSNRITYEQSCAGYDIAMIEILNPKTRCNLLMENVKLKVQNTGGSTVSSLQLQHIINTSAPVTANVSQMLYPGAYFEYSFTQAADFTQPGQYIIDVSVNNLFDTITTNNHLADTVFNTSFLLPQQVDFSGFTGTNLHTLFPGWQQAQGVLPSGNTAMWSSSTGLGGGSNATAKINFYSAPIREWILGPAFAVTDYTVLTFDAAVTAYGNFNPYPTGMAANDRLFVKLSLDCGETWFDIDTLKNSNNLPNSLTTITKNLNQYSGQVARVAFYAHRPSAVSNDYDFHLDNIMIEDFYPVDLMPMAIAAPLSDVCFGTEDGFIVSIANQGLDTAFFDAHPLTITATVSGPIGIQTFLQIISSGFLAPGLSSNYLLSNMLNMNTAGAYDIQIIVSAANNGNPENDTLNIQYINTNPFIEITGDTLICAGVNTQLTALVVNPGTGPLTQFANNTTMGIPDNNVNGVNSFITVSGASNINAADIISVKVNITHTFVSDLILKLSAPDNSTITLAHRRGGSTDHYNNVVFAMTATDSIATTPGPFSGTYVPEEFFSSLTGGANGNWKFNVSDVLSSDVGSLQGWEISLHVDNQIVTYSWSTGDNQPQITVSPLQTTSYQLTVTDSKGCESIIGHDLEVFGIASFSLGNDTGLCYGQSIIFDIGTNFTNAVWHDMSQGQFYTSSQTEQVVVTLTNQCGTFSDTAAVTIMPAISFNITSDSVACVNQPFGLYGPTGYSAYAWSTFEATQDISVISSQPAQENYSLTVTDVYGCQATESLLVQFTVCTHTDELTISPVRIYPVPANNYIIIEGLTAQNNKFRIYNMMGQIVLSADCGSNDVLNIQNLPNGLYTLLIEEVNLKMHKLKFLKVD